MAPNKEKIGDYLNHLFKNILKIDADIVNKLLKNEDPGGTKRSNIKAEYSKRYISSLNNELPNIYFEKINNLILKKYENDIHHLQHLQTLNKPDEIISEILKKIFETIREISTEEKSPINIMITNSLKDAINSTLKIKREQDYKKITDDEYYKKKIEDTISTIKNINPLQSTELFNQKPPLSNIIQECLKIDDLNDPDQVIRTIYKSLDIPENTLTIDKKSIMEMALHVRKSHVYKTLSNDSDKINESIVNYIDHLKNPAALEAFHQITQDERVKKAVENGTIKLGQLYSAIDKNNKSISDYFENKATTLNNSVFKFEYQSATKMSLNLSRIEKSNEYLINIMQIAWKQATEMTKDLIGKNEKLQAENIGTIAGVCKGIIGAISFPIPAIGHALGAVVDYVADKAKEKLSKSHNSQVLKANADDFLNQFMSEGAKLEFSNIITHDKVAILDTLAMLSNVSLQEQKQRLFDMVESTKSIELKHDQLQSNQNKLVENIDKSLSNYFKFIQFSNEAGQSKYLKKDANGNVKPIDENSKNELRDDVGIKVLYNWLSKLSVNTTKFTDETLVKIGEHGLVYLAPKLRELSPKFKDMGPGEYESKFGKLKQFGIVDSANVLAATLPVEFGKSKSLLAYLINQANNYLQNEGKQNDPKKSLSTDDIELQGTAAKAALDILNCSDFTAKMKVHLIDQMAAKLNGREDLPVLESLRGVTIALNNNKDTQTFTTSLESLSKKADAARQQREIDYKITEAANSLLYKTLNDKLSSLESLQTDLMNYKSKKQKWFANKSKRKASEVISSLMDSLLNQIYKISHNTSNINTPDLLKELHNTVQKIRVETSKFVHLYGKTSTQTPILKKCTDQLDNIQLQINQYSDNYRKALLTSDEEKNAYTELTQQQFNTLKTIAIDFNQTINTMQNYIDKKESAWFFKDHEKIASASAILRLLNEIDDLKKDNNLDYHTLRQKMENLRAETAYFRDTFGKKSSLYVTMDRTVKMLDKSFNEVDKLEIKIKKTDESKYYKSHTVKFFDKSHTDRTDKESQPTHQPSSPKLR